MEESKSVKQAELETLIAAKDSLGNDKPDGNFFARTLPRANWDKPWMQGIERIVSSIVSRSCRTGRLHSI